MPVISSTQGDAATAFAQIALSRASGRADGLLNDRAAQLVTGVDDIEQEIRIVLLTPLGADPHRPDFGSDWWTWIDTPINVARAHIVRAVVGALERWVTRIRLVRVVVEQVAADAPQSAALTIDWAFADGVAEQVFSSNLLLYGALALEGTA